MLFSLFCVLGLILWFVEIGIREASIPNMSPVFYIVCSAYQLVMWPSGGLGFVKSPAHPHVTISSPTSDMFIIYLISATMITGQVLRLLLSGRQLNPEKLIICSFKLKILTFFIVLPISTC